MDDDYGTDVYLEAMEMAQQDERLPDIDYATRLQKSLMERYKQWFPLDVCLEIIREVLTEGDA